MLTNLKLILLGSFTLFSNLVFAQKDPFEIKIEAININGLNGIQSFAHAEHNGKWLIIGGRLDGLHRRQPFAAFDIAGNNNQLIVIDPLNKQVWKKSITSLPIEIQEQLSSTNMEFHQEGDILYLIGGYGYNAASASKKTFNTLTAINVSLTIDAVINNAAINTYFRQIINEQFAVTGGHLEKINDTYYLIGGNRFDGNYNPMGNPTYVQVYTDAIRKFKIHDDGVTINIIHTDTIIDAASFHRRDYNAVAQILPDGTEGISVFSGVFQPSINLPFLNSIRVDSNSYQIEDSFNQYYNHYHCAVLPIYSETTNNMHTLFFGGIAQFYDSAGVLVQDNNVPFVKTIARVTRDKNGKMSEYKLPIEMPNFLGAGSEFILNGNITKYKNNVIRFDQLSNDTNLLGYIFGGINSTAKNIFFTNTGNESSASNSIFKVYLIKNDSLQSHTLNDFSINPLKVYVYPNPINNDFHIKFYLSKLEKVELSFYNVNGELLTKEIIDNVTIGENNIRRKLLNDFPLGAYIIQIKTSENTAYQKIIID